MRIIIPTAFLLLLVSVIIGCGGVNGAIQNGSAGPSPTATPQIHGAAVAMQVNVGPDGNGASIEYVDAQMGGGQMTTWGAPLTPSARYVTFSGAPLDQAQFYLANCHQANPPAECATPLYNNVYVRDTCTGADASCVPQTVLISATTDGTPANGASIVSTISDDARYVAFESSATNLVAIPPPFTPAIYIRDTCIGTAGGCTPATTLLSVATDGSPANGPSYRPRVTSNGRFVLFRSLGSNLAPNDANNSDDVFLRDTCINAPPGCSPSTILVSLAPDGSQFPAGVSPGDLTDDGRFVVFDGFTAMQSGYIRDTCIGAVGACTATTVPVSGTQLATPSSATSISADGRYVSFVSGDPSFLPGCTPDPTFGTCMYLGYVRDTCFGATGGCTPANIRVTLATDGSLPNQDAGSATLARGGRFVVFNSAATNLVPNDTNATGTFTGDDIFVRDTCLGADASCLPSTVRSNVASDGTQADNYSVNPAINFSGHYVTFWSLASTLIPGTPPQPSEGQVFRLYLSKIN